MSHLPNGASTLASLAEDQRPFREIRTQLIILGFFPLSEAIAWTTIFPYIYSMVQSFSPGSGDQNAAVYAGVMVSVFTFGEFIMAPQWAKISDKIGRKPTLLIGSIGAILSAILFGFSSSLSMAIAARTCAGLLNPNLGVVQTFVGELVRKEHQAKGFSIVPFLRGFGILLGPVVGGYLAEPVKKYPSIFRENTLWDAYPYLLPNVVVVLCLVLSCLLGLLFLEEVHPKFRGQIDLGTRIVNIVWRGSSWMAGTGVYSRIATGEVENMELTQMTTEGVGDSEQSTFKPTRAFTRQVILQIISVAIFGFLKIATLALVPILLATPPHPKQASATSKPNPTLSSTGYNGGFGLDSTSISNVLLSQAVAAIISQIVFVPAIISTYGPLSSYRMILIALFLFYLFIPLTAELLLWARIPGIVFILWIYALANGLGTTSSAILITNTAPSPHHLATINGAAASFGCLARTLGPMVSGPLFRLGLEVGNIGLPFYSLGAVTSVGIFVSLFQRDHP